jgi:branched-chain amino acid aminotransferase
VTGEARPPAAWLDGRLVPRAEARVPIDDLGFLYGAACFETMRAAGGFVFRLDRHLARLARGLALLGVAPPDSDALHAAVDATIEANALPEARVRLTVAAGPGGGPDLASAGPPRVLVTADPLSARPAAARLEVGDWRVDERSPLRAAKTANYLPYLLARTKARAAGFEDALMRNSRGDVAEAATANLFAVLDGRLTTPPPEDGPLPGVTQEAVIECARSLGHDVVEAAIPLALLERASEVFLTNSIVGVWPVAEIGGADMTWRAPSTPSGMGEVTAALASSYERLTAEERDAAQS